MKSLLKYPSWLLCAMTLSITLFSCQKNGDDATPDDSKLSSKDPQAVSAAVSVWHGKRTTGIMPASTNSADLKLGTPDESSINAIAGRHAFIHTNVESGNVAGYYVQINGASEYFKVDYAKPVVQSSTQQGSISTASVHMPGQPAKTTSRHRSPINVTGVDDNYNDSIIVINIPVDIKTPDTVCITYMAYDINNHVSNPVSTCIYIDHLGGDNDSKWLEGNWVVVREERSLNGQLLKFHDYVYNKWMVREPNIMDDYDSPATKCYQSGDSIVVAYQDSYTVYFPGYNYHVFSSSFTAHPSDKLLATDSAIFYKRNLNFVNSGTYKSESSSAKQYLYWDNGLAFNNSSDYTLDTGAWSYDSKTNKLIIVSEYTDYGDGPNLEPYMEELPLIKVSNDKWKISYEGEEMGKTYTYTTILQRQ